MPGQAASTTSRFAQTKTESHHRHRVAVGDTTLARSNAETKANNGGHALVRSMMGMGLPSTAVTKATPEELPGDATKRRGWKNEILDGENRSLNEETMS